jgi:2-oxo-hept-3-ene-1,7-dioate hydratase
VTLTLTIDEIADIAAAHEKARRTRVALRRVTLQHPQMNIDDAYACQKAWVDQQIADGCTVGGHKIGLTSRAMQQAVNIDEPDFGTLLDYMFIDSGVTLAAATFLDPKLEVELAFVLGDRLEGADVTPADVIAATEYVVPAAELIDARSYRTDPFDGITRTVFDTISDNAANAGIITGGVRSRADQLDLRWVGAIMKRNGVVEETGLAAGVLDDPVMGIVWLARRFAQFGIALEPGQTILAGSFTRPVACRPGDEFHIDFGPLGALTCAFT